MSTPVVMPQMGESITEGTIVRWIKKVGDSVEFGGLLGYCPIVPVKNEYSSAAFIARGGRIPAPIRSLTN